MQAWLVVGWLTLLNGGSSIQDVLLDGYALRHLPEKALAYFSSLQIVSYKASPNTSVLIFISEGFEKLQEYSKLGFPDIPLTTFIQRPRKRAPPLPLSKKALSLSV